METSLLGSAPPATQSLPELAALSQPHRPNANAGQAGFPEFDGPFAAVLQSATEQIAPLVRSSPPVRSSSSEEAVPSVPASRPRRTPLGGQSDAAPLPEQDAARSTTSSADGPSIEGESAEPAQADPALDEIAPHGETQHTDEGWASLFALVMPPALTPAPPVLEAEAPPVSGADSVAQTPPEAAPAPAGENVSFDLNLEIKAASEPDGSPASIATETDASANDVIDPPPVESRVDMEISALAEMQPDTAEVTADLVPSVPMVNPITESSASGARETGNSPVRAPLPPAPSPVPEAARVSDPRPTGTLNRIGLMVREAEQVVRLDIRQGAEGVRVVVRSGDHGLSQHLRYGLPELIERLEEQGFDPKRMDAVQARGSRPDRDADPREQRPRRQQPAWDPHQDE